MWNNNILELGNKTYALQDSNNVIVTNFKYYVSNLALFYNNNLTYTIPDIVHLIDIKEPNSNKILVYVPKNVSYNKICFNLGIDSTINVSGAMGGDLDPTKGMYWTWQSGYINFKLEGNSNICKTRNNEFHYHLGGYSYPFVSMQQIILNTEQTDSIVINVDVASFIKQCDLAHQNSVMIPSEQAVKLSRIAASIFSIQK